MSGGRDAAPAPSADGLVRLRTDLWDRLAAAARAAVHADDDGRAGPRLRQLAATPSARLRGGRARRDLADALAAGDWLWRAVEQALAAERGGPEVLAAARAPAPEETEPRGPAGPDPAREDWWRARESRLKERAARLLRERDEAIRRAEGLEARLRTVESREVELEARLAAAEEESAALRRRIDEAEQATRREVERVTRRYEGRMEEATAELRTLRGERERREVARRREEEAGRLAEARAQEELAAHRAVGGRGQGGRRATPGRPSRLPPGVLPGTTEALRCLLLPGMRIVVDGYNVTMRHRGSAPLEQQRRWLVGVCDTLAARTGIRPTVVFDGSGEVVTGSVRGRATRVAFSDGRSADDEIVALVEGLPTDDPVVVVTDDRELGAAVGRAGADVAPTDALVDLAE